ncbi:puratrophin-1-like isoform X1 [Euwallacea similis]|uniref:puratrophin-1-like isoform X1 n=1 Tax=Euwallacea similis TaxID=1736056 RepID=UPI003450F8D1
MLCGQCSEENADIVIDLLSKVGGACTYCYEVTPTNQKAITYDEESWKPRPEDPLQREKSPDPSTPSTSSSSKSSSKAKKVKKYLKKCKNALGSSKSSSFDCETASQISTNSSSSWYVDPRLEGLIQKGEIHEIVEQFEDEVVDLQDSKSVKFEVANIIQVKLPNGVEPDDICSKKSTSIEENFQSALSSVSTETLKSDDCEYFSLDSRTFERDETDYKHKQNVIEFSFHNSRTNSENWDYSDSVTAGGTAEVDSKESLGDGKNFVPLSTSPVLSGSQDVVDGAEVGNGLAANALPVKSEVEGLIDKYFCSIYQNYSESKKCLVRQARDLLVCEYRGCLSRFESEFCSQASKLLQHLKNEQSADLSSPSGWPLCLGRSGVVVHFTPLDVSHLRNRDCYLTLTRRNTPILEVTLIWKLHQEIHSRTVAEFRNPLNSIDDIMCSSVRAAADLKVGCADECDGTQLPELLQNLLVSVEHAIKRVPLDDLTFPCPQCQQYLPLDRQEDDQSSCSCQCLCRPPDSTVTKKDSSMQTSPMFEFVGSIPHIDSDSDDDKETIRTGAPNKKMEIARPRSISELPEKLLMSGINLPGTIDNDGRPIILCYAECISRAALNKYEIAKLLLYYSSIPMSESREKGFTILLLAENEADYKMLEMLDKSICLIGNCIKIHRFLIWTPGMIGGKNDKDSRTLASQVEAILVTEESSLKEYLAQDQTPASCGGTCIHDQLEWVEFFKQLEPFITTCTSAGQSLLKTLSHLRSEEVPPQVTRRFLNHQCRQISRALDSETIQRLRREGNKTVTSLAERGQWLASSRDVKRSTTFASDSYNAVERVTKRLEQLRLERMERLKELARYRTMQDEAEELLQWTKNVGDEKIGNLTLLLCSSADSKGVKEVANSFDEFFFIAWKQIEKSNDLTEECKNIVDSKAQHLKEVCSNLAAQMRSFREHLEETRERIEDSSRCFLLLETCQDILEDDSAEQEEFFKLAERSGNEKLLQLSKNFKNSNSLPKPHDHPPDKPADPDKSPSLYSSSEFSASSTPQRSQNTQIRRRSVSSMAYIYHCSHHAAGELCNCCESDTENSVSYKLKKRYIQMHNCNCQAAVTRELERKNSGTLGGIKEERESVENLLEKIENLDSNCKRCDSGLSTADNSVGDDSSHSYKESKMKMQRMCSCQYYKETCTICSNGSSSGGSSQDNAENQQDSINDDRFNKSHSSDEIEDDPYMEDRRKVPPVQANNHLYCHASTLDLPSDALYHTMEPKTQKTLTYIIREMIETERDYVRSLDYIIVNYIPELQREDIPQALRGHRNTVFGNVEKIYEFHSHSFLEELEECEHNPLQVGQIFLKYDKRFYLYALYNKNKPKSDSLMSEYGSLFFKSKQMELGDRMDLASYLLKPVQRMGKYALLLQQMMKACTPALINSPERNIQDLEDLRQAEEMVRFQLRHGNDLLAMDSIRECDVNLKEQGRLLRQNEFLVWEGRSGKKSLRQVFLFEELILFSKARRFPDRKNLDLYIYKNSIKMTDIGLTARIGETPTKFEIWFRKRKPNDTFTLQSMSEDVKRAWTEELSQLLWKQAIRNRAVRMAEMSSMGIGNKPCLDIRPSADQISDRSISIAQLSKNLHSDFCLVTRKWRVNAIHLYNSFRSAPRFRNSIAGPAPESCRTIKRPHSVISVSSVSSSSTSSGGSGGHSTSQGHSSIGFDSNFDSPKPYRSATLNSQCSVESGIIADISVASDDYTEQSQHTTS